MPRAQPSLSLTNVRSCTVNPAGTGPPTGTAAPAAPIEAEAVGFAVRSRRGRMDARHRSGRAGWRRGLGRRAVGCAGLGQVPDERNAAHRGTDDEKHHAGCNRRQQPGGPGFARPALRPRHRACARSRHRGGGASSAQLRNSGAAGLRDLQASRSPSCAAESVARTVARPRLIRLRAVPGRHPIARATSRSVRSSSTAARGLARCRSGGCRMRRLNLVTIARQPASMSARRAPRLDDAHATNSCAGGGPDTVEIGVDRGCAALSGHRIVSPLHPGPPRMRAESTSPERHPRPPDRRRQ